MKRYKTSTRLPVSCMYTRKICENVYEMNKTGDDVEAYARSTLKIRNTNEWHKLTEKQLVKRK